MPSEVISAAYIMKVFIQLELFFCELILIYDVDI
jgi:hypothetical protein